MAREATIYAILDPDTAMPRYIGVTTRGLAVRLSKHMADARHGRRAPIFRWLASLSCRPQIVAIETSPVRLMFQREAYWIGRMRADSPSLLNAREPIGREDFAMAAGARRMNTESLMELGFTRRCSEVLLGLRTGRLGIRGCEMAYRHLLNRPDLF